MAADPDRGSGPRTPILLASGSPRRSELLAGAGVEFTVMAADIDETPLRGETPSAMVLRLAVAKAEAVAHRNPDGLPVVAADTTVDLDGLVVGKPSSLDEARQMLESLSGRWHQVHTGVALVANGRTSSIRVTTDVRFVALRPQAIAAYLAVGEPLDKAGGYAMQGRAAAFVAEVRGSVTNVIGLPLAETLELLRGI